MIVITVARKPLSQPTVAANVLKHGTGALNIDATRVPYADDDVADLSAVQRQQSSGGKSAVSGAFGAEALVGKEIPTYKEGGRWPANLVIRKGEGDNCPTLDFDGCANYFMQLFNETELVAYIKKMVVPEGGRFVELHVDQSWAEQSDLHAAFVHGDVSEAQASSLLDALLPGGHLFQMASPAAPTGHVGACRLEDAGFEIRDAILWVTQRGKNHYVAKPGRAEREAGVAHLAANADARGNTHPTVKSKALMERLLSTVPKDQGPVLDPFMGSGTTMIACAATGHDGIGIEREAEYLPIADARVRHWSLDASGWPKAEIVSDLGATEGQQPKSEPEVLDFFSFMDGE